MRGTRPPDARAIRAVFDQNEPGTVGLEEEVLLLDPSTFQPVPVAAEVVRAAAHPQIKTELPACQVEIITEPHRTAAAAARELAAGRARLIDTCGGDARPAAAAVHPHLQQPVAVSANERSRAMGSQYGIVAERQVVGALQVHVAVGDADAALAVYNALRGLLPELAALASAAPIHEGRDTGLSSVRPLICAQLPRQGVPPVLRSWEAYADELAWGADTGWVPEAGRWWWELRPHVVHGTLEVRVPDVQPTIEAARAVASLVQALVLHLVDRHRDGEALGAPSSWRIAENRWSALRDGTHGEMADLVTGETMATTSRLHQLIDASEPFAGGGLDGARTMVGCNSADQLRRAGPERSARWLAEVFAPDGEG
ncbi:carboxylate-amine ligase [Aquihabitans sp. McL0605]|uniref:carboxylate-amine ligase n=1 Tax=Aquihabitans sp. McL0605 TaxID=3415671 RepID=UPI003CF65A15